MIKIKIEQNKQRRFKPAAVNGPVIDRVRSSLYRLISNKC